MTKLSARGTQTKSGSKKPEKSLKNLLTNGNSCDIIYRLPTRGNGEPKRTPKKLKKVLKNLLTNESDCDIIYRLLTKAASERKAH